MRKVQTIFESMKNAMMHRVAATQDELEAFQIAMQMEQEGISFYRQVETEAGNQKEKQLFERLIQEEQQHYDIFANTYNFMKDTGNWFMWEEHSIVDKTARQ